MILFRLMPNGFRSANLCPYLAELSGALTYQLRRLRLHGMVERLPNSYSYALPGPSYTSKRRSLAAITELALAPKNLTHVHTISPNPSRAVLAQDDLGELRL